MPTVANLADSKFRVLSTTIPSFFNNTNAYTYYTRGQKFYLYTFDSQSGYRTDLALPATDTSSPPGVVVLRSEVVPLKDLAMKPHAGFSIGDIVRVTFDEGARTAKVENITKGTFASGTLLSSTIRWITVSTEPPPPPPPSDTSAPQVSINAPPSVSGVTLPYTFNLTGTATDNVQVVKVEVQVDGGVLMMATGTTSWSRPVSIGTPGSHTVTARATDAAGNVGTTSKSFSISEVKTYNINWALVAVGLGVLAVALR